MENEREILDGYEEAYTFLDAKSIHEVRNLARAFGVKAPTSDKKHDLIVRLIGLASGAIRPDPKNNKGAKVKAEDASQESVEKVRKIILQCKARLPYRVVEPEPKEYEFHDSGETEKKTYGYADKCYAGLLQLEEMGGGRLRSVQGEVSDEDAYVPESLIRKYYLREGDFVSGYAEGDAPPRIVQIAAIEGTMPVFTERKKFESLPAAYPNEQFKLGLAGNAVLQAMDLLSPIGYGQRVMLFAPRESGMTTFLRMVAEAAKADGAVPMFVLLGQRPEEISEIRQDFRDSFVAATGFDEPIARGAYLAAMAMQRAKRFAERGNKVVLLLDSVSALERAFAETNGAFDVKRAEEAAKLQVKQYFAAARRLEGAGSITVLAASGEGLSSELSSELASAANAVMFFSIELAARGIYPAIDLKRSRSKRPDAFFTQEEREKAMRLRTALEELNDTAEFLEGFAKAADQK